MLPMIQSIYTPPYLLSFIIYTVLINQYIIQRSCSPLDDDEYRQTKCALKIKKVKAKISSSFVPSDISNSRNPSKTPTTGATCLHILFMPLFLSAAELVDSVCGFFSGGDFHGSAGKGRSLSLCVRENTRKGPPSRYRSRGSVHHPVYRRSRFFSVVSRFPPTYVHSSRKKERKKETWCSIRRNRVKRV